MSTAGAARPGLLALADACFAAAGPSDPDLQLAAAPRQPGDHVVSHLLGGIGRSLLAPLLAALATNKNLLNSHLEAVDAHFAGTRAALGKDEGAADGVVAVDVHVAFLRALSEGSPAWRGVLAARVSAALPAAAALAGELSPLSRGDTAAEFERLRDPAMWARCLQVRPRAWRYAFANMRHMSICIRE